MSFYTEVLAYSKSNFNDYKKSLDIMLGMEYIDQSAYYKGLYDKLLEVGDFPGRSDLLSKYKTFVKGNLPVATSQKTSSYSEQPKWIKDYPNFNSAVEKANGYYFKDSDYKNAVKWYLEALRICDTCSSEVNLKLKQIKNKIGFSKYKEYEQYKKEKYETKGNNVKPNYSYLTPSTVYIANMVDIPMRSSNKIERHNSNLLKMLPSGTQLTVLSTKNGWTQVRFENTTGWIISRYLKTIDQKTYITDEVDIPMRSAGKIQNNPSNLLKMLPSYTQLELLSTENGWSKVRLDNQEGWIIARYLTSKKPEPVIPSIGSTWVYNNNRVYKTSDCMDEDDQSSDSLYDYSCEDGNDYYYGLGAVFRGNFYPNEYLQTLKDSKLGKYELGSRYLGEWGDDTKRKKGFNLILESATSGYSKAQYKLASLYATGSYNIVYEDLKKAFDWYKKSATQGHAESQYEVGAMYHYGEGTSKNYMQAIKWDTKAAPQNQGDAQYELGQMYANGQGVSIDYKKAIKWYSRAAEQNDTRASNKVKALLALEKNKAEKTTFVDINPPEIRTYNSDSFTTTDKYITLAGDIKDDSKIAKVTINGKEIGVKNDGFNQFSVTEYIQLGRNVFNIVSTDVFGNKSTKTIVFNREKPAAKNKDKRLIPPTAMMNSNPNAVALIIGVDNYESITSAPWAESDASVFYDYAQNALGISDDRIRLITGSESSEAGIWRSVERWLPTEVDKNKSDVYVYFAGHGLASADGNNAYLIPWDGDPDLLERTAILRSELIDGLKDLNAANVTLFMDTCYSGKARGGKGTLVADSRGLRIVKKDTLYNLPDNFTLFAAAANDETASSHPSLKHGLFSYWMMRGLGGDADSNGDRKITNGELHAFIDKNVQKNAVSIGRKQHPQLVGDKDKVISSW